MKAKKLVQLSLFTVIAVTIFVIEAALPPIVPIQGVKLGLANIVTLVLLLYDSPKDVFLVLFARIMLGSILGGQMMSFLYSLSGGVLCFVAMTACNRLIGRDYIYITSVVGAIFHNAGQLLMALLLLQTKGVLLYAPILMISGIITGLFTGLCAHFFRKKMGEKLPL